jgi:hypothetical protein
MVEFQPTLQNNTSPECIISCPGVSRGMERSKIRLELRDGLQGCTPSFFVSADYAICVLSRKWFADNMQITIAQKERPGEVGSAPRISNLYTMEEGR